MAEVNKVEERYETVERVVEEEVLVRSAGYELFLTQEEMEGLRALIGSGISVAGTKKLGLTNLWEQIYDKMGFNFKYVRFTQNAVVQGEFE